jgi:hypothetical protein
MAYFFVSSNRHRIDEFLGYSVEEMEGKSAYEFHHILDHDAVIKSYKTRASYFSHILFFPFIGKPFLITGLFYGIRHQFWPKVSAKRPSTVFWLATEGSSGSRLKPRWSMVHVTHVRKLSCASTMF